MTSITLLILSSSILVFILLLTAFYIPAKNSEKKKRRLNAIAGSYKSEFDEDLEKPFMQRFLFPIFKSIMKSLSNILPKNKKNTKSKTEKSLRLAGINLNANEYNATRIMITCGFVMGALIINALIFLDFKIELLIVIFSLMISLIIPTYYLKFRISSRQEGIRNQLPDVMDLLSVSMEAGLGFDSALIKIGERLNGPLVDELNMVLMEIQLGRPRREALKILLERSDVEELKAFISSMIQAEQLGIPIKNVLSTQAQQLRITRRQKAEQKAMKAPIKMMLPLVVFVFPVLFIILLGPTIIQVIEQFGGK